VNAQGRKRIRFHDLRHTFASLLIAQGEHPKYISEQLGHASVQITLDRYGHLMPQNYDQAGDRLEAALFGSALDVGAQVRG
jgi:integrase